MRWYALVSLMSDSRIKFLLWFVVVAIIVAIAMILIEVNLKRKREREAARLANESPIQKMRKFLEYNKTSREKLDFIDKTAKEYFRDTYGTDPNSNYSRLIEDFTRNRRKNEAVFCRTMFETYYSHEKLSDKDIVSLGNLLVDVERKKIRADELSRVPTFMERIGRFFKKRKNKLAVAAKKREELVQIKVIEKQKAEKRKAELKTTEKQRTEKRKAELKAIEEKNVIARRQREKEAMAKKKVTTIPTRNLEERKAEEAPRASVSPIKTKTFFGKKKDKSLEWQKQLLKIKKQKEEIEKIEKKRLESLEKKRAAERVEEVSMSREMKMFEERAAEAIAKNKAKAKRKFAKQKISYVEPRTTRKTSMLPSFIGRVKSFYAKRREERKKNKIEGEYVRRYKITQKDERKVREWTREAIRGGYDRKEVSGLLADGTRSPEEAKEILKIYDEEVSRRSRKKVHKTTKEKEVLPSSSFKKVSSGTNNNETGGGIAERIIRREKDRLGREGVLASGF